jgi:hypothetical protein
MSTGPGTDVADDYTPIFSAKALTSASVTYLGF